MNMNILPSNRFAFMAVIDPDQNGAGTINTGWLDAGDVDSFLAMIMAGTMETGSTIDAKFEQAKDSSGTDAKDVDGKAITQLTEAGGDSDKQALINCMIDDLDVENGFSHVRLSLTVAAAASDSAAFVIGLDARYQPASHVASVAEVV